MKTQKIREKFAKFFHDNNHQKVSSSSLIPYNDNTLLFTNAGMNQFKDYFIGKSIPSNKRAFSLQKCVRAGGKHNDLDNVGHTARHHTFFEMLGNFSFGDYFKEEAIQYAWDFLTQELLLPKEKLYVTVHTSDEEAFNIWHKKIGIPSKRLFKRGDTDNFWEMGEFGPCGPCSEIFFDHGEKFSQKKSQKNLLDDEFRYVEIWNLVFMQFEKTPQGQHALPNPCVDTGMGLERIASCLQNVYWNYDTDGFKEIISAIEDITKKNYHNQKYAGNIRVVADHIRSCTMLLTDGVIPSNEGRGYVLRRIIRRASRNLKKLDMHEAILHKLVPVVFKQLGQEYPQNNANQKVAEEFLYSEENKFLETLDQGLKFLKDAIKNNIVEGTLSGKSAFKLYDTYGFPLDLTETILAEKNLKVDIRGFNESMQIRKNEGRKSWKGHQNINNDIFHKVKEENGTTRFVGYDTLNTKSKLLDIIDVGNQKGLVFDITPFYGESGGQVGDSGEIWDNENKLVEILDTQIPIEGLYVHYCNDANSLKKGKEYQLFVDKQRRQLTARNHSATHLLQAALIKILGKHVQQAGSHVNAERLRFDFTHMKAISHQEIDAIGNLVNEQIQASLPVEAAIMNLDEAINQGATALFGEKYGDQVRVLKMGTFSTELCGGTHVCRTEEIGIFDLISESSLSSGVRRIEAVTSTHAIQRLMERSQYLKEIEKLTLTKENSTVKKIQELCLNIKDQQKQIQEIRNQVYSVKSNELFSKPTLLKNGISFISAKAPENSDLRKVSDLFADKFNKGVLLLYAEKKGKLSVLLRATKNLKSIQCNQILQEALLAIDGKGGGQTYMAQGSGNIDGVESLIKRVRSLLEPSS